MYFFDTLKANDKLLKGVVFSFKSPGSWIHFSIFLKALSDWSNRCTKPKKQICYNEPNNWIEIKKGIPRFWWVLYTGIRSLCKSCTYLYNTFFMTFLYKIIYIYIYIHNILNNPTSLYYGFKFLKVSTISTTGMRFHLYYSLTIATLFTENDYF